MSYSFLYTAAALLGLVTPMDQALMAALENPALERGGAVPGLDSVPRPLPFRPPGGEWSPVTGGDGIAASNGDRPPASGRWKTRGTQPVAARAYVVHLASYLGETWAHRGWGELRLQAPPLTAWEADFRHADVPSLGPVIRVTIGHFDTLQGAAATCAQLRRHLEYCAPLALHGTTD
jgi:hypothetical protein